MSSYSEGQVHQLMEKLQAGGFTPDDLTKLGQYPRLDDLRRAFHGEFELKRVDHVIDLDADPFVPDGWKVEEHHKGGSFTWNPNAVEFYLSEPQRKGKWIEGNELRTELAGKPVLNANVLDYLLAHPYLNPESWKKDEQGRIRYILFWGTIYRRPDGGLCVRCLCWSGGRWSWGYRWLGRDWSDDSPAARV